MPQATFFNLPERKRNSILAAAIEEFSAANYDTASINQICKTSNMAKGSFYQYFTDKLDLYVYIMTSAVEAKIRYFSATLAEADALTFSEQIRLLFMKGVEFAGKYPQYAALGEQFAKETNESAILAVKNAGNKQAESLFLKMIQQAQSNGDIDSSVNPLALSMLLQSVHHAVHQYMLDQQREEDVSSFADALFNIILHGIQRRKLKEEEHE